MKALIVFLAFKAAFGLLDQTQRKYQPINIDYYEIQEETESLNTPSKCCMYCSQWNCCEGSIFEETNNCKLLQNVHLSQNTTQTKAWINSEIGQVNHLCI